MESSRITLYLMLFDQTGQPTKLQVNDVVRFQCIGDGDIRISVSREDGILHFGDQDWREIKGITFNQVNIESIVDLIGALSGLEPEAHERETSFIFREQRY